MTVRTSLDAANGMTSMYEERTMRARPEIMELQGTGSPFLKISADELWAFVEFLSYRRERVAFSYHAAAFTVTFHQGNRQTLEVLLDDWVKFIPMNATGDGNFAQHSA